MMWAQFYIFAILFCSLLTLSGILTLCKESLRKWASLIGLLGSLILLIFIIGLWTSLGHPPMRTMGETRLWYSFFLSLAGAITYHKSKYWFVLNFSSLISIVFIIINLFNPEIHDKELMPILRSAWFIPHVSLYMFAYGILACASIVSIWTLMTRKSNVLIKDRLFELIDRLVLIGNALITIAMLMGAIWAKQAWGDYWAWDAKENWAAITWITYMFYLHLRFQKKNSNFVLILVIAGFIFLQICWWGINYLPWTQNSVHIYNN
ncbi:MAG: cytochrome c biogenesis protein [Bacteroidales bacterium]